MASRSHLPETKSVARDREMDALRGAAMVAVCVSHSSQLVNGTWHSAMGAALIWVGMIATPMFLLLSGLVCGYLSRITPETDRQFRWRFMDRGLFLLLIAHPLLSLTHAVVVAAPSLTFGNFYITDAVGVALIAGAVVARRVKPRNLLLLGLLLFVGAWFISSCVSPRSDSLRLLTRILFGVGEESDGDEGYIVPLVPYVGIFLIGIAAGIIYSQRRAHGLAQLQIGRFCVLTGLACMVVAVGVKVAWLMAKPHLPQDWATMVYGLTNPLQKIPPGPAYALAYGGAGIFLAGIVCLLSHFGRLRSAISALAVIGRASLVTFIAQYWLYYLPTKVPGFSNAPWLWFIAMPASLGVLWLLAFFWDRRGYNRFITLGLRRFGEAQDAEVPVKASAS